jgi:hypothetical protein
MGFINGDGHFYTSVQPNKTNTGFYFRPGVRITQDNISLIALEYIINFIGMGKIYLDGSNRSTSTLVIYGIDNINNLISIFSCYKFYGSKALDYADFCKIVKIINSNNHLTKEGSSEIISIIESMNNKRTKFK